MHVKISVLGPDIALREKTDLDLVSPTLRDVIRALLEQDRAKWERILQDDFTPSEGYEILVNGRNMKSLEGIDTKIGEGDEIVFTVPLSGG
jgi:molybdopterin converting factor small subunit